MAQRLGIEPTAMIRVRAGISFALAEATGEGHCGLPLAELTAQTAALIEVPPPLIQTAMELELEAGEVVVGTLEGRAASSWPGSTALRGSAPSDFPTARG